MLDKSNKDKFNRDQNSDLDHQKFSETEIGNNGSFDGIFAFDREMRVTAWNSIMETLTGHAASHVVGKSLLDIFPHLSENKAYDLYQKILKGDPVPSEEREFFHLSAGEKSYYEGNWTPLYNSEKKVIGGLTIIRDVIKRKMAEKKLLEQEMILVKASKMASLGEMAGGIAHEINTPLGIIILNAGRIKDCLTTKEVDRNALTASLEIIESTTFRIAKVLKDLRFFAQEGTNSDFKRASLKSIIEDTLSFCSERFKSHGVDFTWVITPEDLMIDCYTVQISHLLLNLLNNAHDAVQLYKTKWIRLEAAVHDDVVEIAIIDSGNGIDPSLQEKIMQPFFTTKELGKGVGLGLSIAKRIAESHNGLLSLDTKSQRTRFVTRLPKFQTTERDS
jgi:two-component system, LuxR family, sensor histidine kinase DctS